MLALYKNWTSLEFQLNGMQQEVNATQKAITNKKKNKEDADAELARKKELDAKIIEFKPNVAAAEQKMRTKARTIANIVGDKVPISQTEDDNLTLRTWLPDGPNASFEKRNDILSHHEVMYRLELFDTERGAKIAGHRGFYLTGDGVDLNQAMINYGLDFLRKKGFKKVMTPFIMRKEHMAKTAQLEDFDEELYKVVGDEEEKYLIATSEQPISAMHSGEWFEKPADQLPIRYAGYSTCFRNCLLYTSPSPRDS